jgi:aminoglycoside phosphotransferase (APT) family kinase protein
MEPAPVPAPEVAGIEPAAVGAWLEANVAGACGPFRYDLIAGGHSNLTYGVTGHDGVRFVLRRPPLGALLASAHDMGREHRIIAALAGTPVPVPPALGLCEDATVTGAPFYVMAWVDGLVLRDRADVDRALPVAGRERASESLVDTLAALHDLDPATVGLGDLGRHDGYIARQLRRWYSQWNAQKTRELPAVDFVHDRLVGRIPEQGPASIVHGDYRLDNTMVDGAGNVVAVLDWEICTLGDPLADIALLHTYWNGPDDAPNAWQGTATTAPGFLGRDALVERYAAVSGRDLSDIGFYLAFASWKLACILEGVYARYLHGAMGRRDPEELRPFAVQVERAAEQAAEFAGRLP